MEENFNSKVEHISSKILELIKNDGEILSWDIKLRLKLSSSVLYLALGNLAAQKKVEIIPDGLNYKIRTKEPVQNG